MNRKLLIFWAYLSCSSFKPADRLLVEHALQNETDEGFISREFFQVKVEVPYSFLETSGKSKREECKRTAFLKRESKALPFLLQVHREKYRFGDGIIKYEGSESAKARLASKAKTTTANSPAGLPGQTPTTQAPSAQTQATIGTQTPIPGQTPPSAKSNPIENLPYTQTFAWFYERLDLYKEDYTDRSKCAFLFRHIQKNLYEKVESTDLPESGYRTREIESDAPPEDRIEEEKIKKERPNDKTNPY